ncbi:MAG: hypothetical protein P1P87_04240 [Trueperaceae bacterium]|nr:hypothetical protein [Trueperaceae bacterium]
MTANPTATTASAARPFTDADHDFPGDRSGTLLGAAAGVFGSAAVLFFWIIGALTLFGKLNATIVMLELDGAWRTTFLAYPFLFVASLVAGSVLASLKRDLEAVGVFGLPVVVAVVYFIALTNVRPLL